MLSKITAAPPDAILGLVEAFNRDPRENKVNLTVGTYRDAKGKTPVLPCVKKAEAALLEEEQTKSYLPIPGNPEFGKHVRELLLGETESSATTFQTPGGTGALRVAGDFLAEFKPGATIWLPSPTWPNHPQVFSRCGLEIGSYSYLNDSQTALDRDAFFADIEALPKQQFVLLHGCCHNPSGVDLSSEDWDRLAAVLQAGKHLPIVDIAYQGYGSDLDRDADGVRALAEHVDELFVCNSFSKTFSLYNERVGGLTFVTKDSDSLDAVVSRLKRCVRTNYSNPPAHGAAIVTKVLGTPPLREEWATDLNAMRDRIRGARHLLVDALEQATGSQRFCDLAHHRGMFSLMGLSADQVGQLRDERSIYLVGNSRLNVAAITPDNVTTVADGIASVL